MSEARNLVASDIVRAGEVVDESGLRHGCGEQQKQYHKQAKQRTR